MQDQRMEGRYQANTGWAVQLLKWASGTMMSAKILQGRTLKSTIPTESRLIIPSPISHFFEKKQTTNILTIGLIKVAVSSGQRWASLFCKTATGGEFNEPYGPGCPEAHNPPRSSLRAQSNGFPKERFLSIVLTRICTKSRVDTSHRLSAPRGTEVELSNVPRVTGVTGLLSLQANSMHPIREFLRKILKVNIQLKN